MIHLRWGIGEIAELDGTGLSQVVTECDLDGSVLREVGFDGYGRPVHRAPDTAARFFLFDGAKVEVGGRTASMSAEQFASVWQDAGVSNGSPIGLDAQAPVIGPFYSHWGFKNWLLHLHPGCIEAEPLGIGVSIRGGALARSGSQVIAQSAYAPERNPSRPDRRAHSELWSLVDLMRIEVRYQYFTANEIRLYWRSGRKLVMGIGFRPSTDHIRTVLRTAYPALYQEHRFKA